MITTLYLEHGISKIIFMDFVDLIDIKLMEKLFEQNTQKKLTVASLNLLFGFRSRATKYGYLVTVSFSKCFSQHSAKVDLVLDSNNTLHEIYHWMNAIFCLNTNFTHRGKNYVFRSTIAVVFFLQSFSVELVLKKINSLRYSFNWNNEIILNKYHARPIKLFKTFAANELLPLLPFASSNWLTVEYIKWINNGQNFNKQLALCFTRHGVTSVDCI